MANIVKNMENKISSLSFLAWGMKMISFAVYTYSFLSFLFWFLNCFEVEWLYLFNWLFIVPYQLVSLFYKPQGVSADFTLAIIGGIFFCFGLLFQNSVNFILEKVILLEDELERVKLQQKRIREARLARRSYKSYSSDIKKDLFVDSKLILLIHVNINKIKKHKEDSNLTFQEAEYWKQLVNKELIKNIDFVKPMQKGYYRKNLFMLYRDFKCVEKILYYLKPALNSIVLEFRKDDVLVVFSVVLSSISDIEQIEKELDCMDTIISLNLINDVIVTNRFKLIYDNMEALRKYVLHLKGEYNLSKNLTVTNNQPVFAVELKEDKLETKTAGEVKKVKKVVKREGESPKNGIPNKKKGVKKNVNESNKNGTQ